VAGIADALDGYETIGIDTSPFIYYIEDHPQYASLVQIILNHLATGTSQGVTSVITMMEISVKPLREQRLARANEYASFLERLPNLSILPVRMPDAWRAGVLRASNTLQIADALQIATCIGAGASVFVTNDHRLRRINEIDILILDDYAEPQ
jgi:predicted nucleic acid-binding protein